MGRRPRNTNPETLRVVVLRVEEAQLLMCPDEELNGTIGGIVAKYQEQFGIIIYAYTFLGNHYHLLLRAPRGNLWLFEQAINREIAKRINWKRKRRGHFWGHRYNDPEVLEASDALEGLLYVVCNAVSHGLVDHPKHWPGLNCFWQLKDGRDRFFPFTDYTEYGRAKRKYGHARLDDFKSVYPLKLSPLPELERLSIQEQNDFLSPLIEKRVQDIRTERKKAGQGFLGRKNILRQSPFSYPMEVKRRPCPLCYTKSFEAKLRFMKSYFPWLEAYREASRKFRSGMLDVEFPPYSIRPPLLYLLPAL